ncbi:MAG: hypothetical protein U1E40_17360 [Amaricoccus sp.]
MSGNPWGAGPGRAIEMAASQVLRALAASAALTLAAQTPARAGEATFADFPVVIYCEYSGVASAYYFSQLSDGVAIYLTPDRQAGAITIDGVAHRVGGDRSGSCQDKTLDDLRASKQAFDLPH